VIPDEAVEAAAWAVDPQTMGSGGALAEKFKEETRTEARRILEAAAPHLMADRKPKLGEGDYAPSWDDRKKLAEVWQGKAPLPEEGLSERVYEALIEVAAWGYQQRADEDL